MNKIKIIADSTCDLPYDLKEKYDIEIIPLHVIMGESDYLDSFNISSNDIYKWSDETKLTPTTSAPSVGEVIEIFEKFKNDFDYFICFTISSEMSSSFQSFKMAAEALDISEMVHVFDSRNLSSGISLLILKAAEMINKGLSFEEIISTTEYLIPLVRSSFVVDALTYLHRGGRCSLVASLASSSLKIHPVILVKDGKMITGSKLRGKMNKVFLTYVQELEKELENADKDFIFITHSGVDDDIVENVRNEIDKYGFKDVIISRANCVISSHCGPNTLGVLFIDRN